MIPTKGLITGLLLKFTLLEVDGNCEVMAIGVTYIVSFLESPGAFLF